MNWREDRAKAGRVDGHSAGSGVGGMPRPDGREPSGRGAATRSARPHPQAGSPRRYAPRWPRPREQAGPSSSRQAFSRRAKITVKVVRPCCAAGAEP